MMEMISVYLEQTPPLIVSMKESFQNQDWNSLHITIEKMIPSFSLMGINADFENIAKKVQEYASTQQQEEDMHELILQLENVCTQACEELLEEFKTMKITQQ